ncbi:hypothetical protein CNR22_01565 [Sphingobacteriaceae bacterium]|nr:hypothetical protein CNR22_01565 [Sphingobacteriaceae bacterium]
METIIVGTDFSLPAQNAVNYAVGLAKHFSAKLVLVNSYSLPIAGYDSLAPLDMISTLQEASRVSLKSLKDEILRENYDFGVECFSYLGTPYGALTDAVAKYSGELVVMGMVGEGSFLKRHIMGSSAVSVARDLEIPTFIVPEAARYRKISSICFACDMDKIEEGTLLYTARDFADIFDAELELVTVDGNDKELVYDKSETYAFAEKRLQGIKHKQVHIEDKNVSKALEYYFKFHKTDVVMVNPRKHTLLQKLFTESVTKSLAYTLETPLLVIH